MLADSEKSEELLQATSSTRRPFEGELASSTLWPEIEKVFGHGYEVNWNFCKHFISNINLQLMSLSVSKSNRMIATSCKATTAEHAVVRVYDTDKWQPVGSPLQGHTLTVTRIAFSPDDRLILSVSRDRTWRLFEKTDDGVLDRLMPLSPPS